MLVAGRFERRGWWVDKIGVTWMLVKDSIQSDFA